MALLAQLFDTTDFPARWYCGNWTELHGWVHIISDLLTFAAYTSIPLVLVYFVRKRGDVPFPRIFYLFCAFIFACGTVHLVEALIFWWPVYRFSALMKATTAVVSWATVMALIPVVPRALKLPALQKMNADLQHEVDERRHVEAFLRESESRFRAVVNTAVDGIVTINAAGRIIFANPAVEALFGYTREQLLGRNVNMLMPNPDRDNHDGYLAQYMRTGEAKIIGIGREVVGRRADGSTFPMYLSIGEFKQDGERFFTGIIHDLTERHEFEIALQHANEELQQKRDEMEEFLSIVAHDLKHPIVSIQGLLTIMKKDAGDRLTEDDHQNLDLSLGECTRMKERLGRLNELRRINRVEVRMETVSLRDFIQRSVDAFRTRIAEQQVAVEIQAPEAEVSLARSLVDEALSNVIDNALSYGCEPDSGRIHIAAALGDHTCTLTIRDEGPGIDPKHHERVFEPFRRLPTPRNTPGSGMGLAAARRLIQRAGGQIRLQSKVGQGTTFILEIPLH